MDVRFPSFAGPSALVAPGAGAVRGAVPGAGVAPGAEAGKTGFAGTLTDALQNVSKLQEQSASMQQQFQLGSDKVGLEQTMIAMQKAQIGFQAALTVRNRFVAAYTDIMNMQV